MPALIKTFDHYCCENLERESPVLQMSTQQPGEAGGLPLVPQLVSDVQTLRPGYHELPHLALSQWVQNCAVTGRLYRFPSVQVYLTL